MKNRNKITKEIKAIGLRVIVNSPGLVVYPKRGEYLIFTSELRRLLTVTLKYNVSAYINFDSGYIRIH